MMMMMVSTFDAIACYILPDYRGTKSWPQTQQVAILCRCNLATIEELNVIGNQRHICVRIRLPKKNSKAFFLLNLSWNVFQLVNRFINRAIASVASRIFRLLQPGYFGKSLVVKVFFLMTDAFITQKKSCKLQILGVDELQKLLLQKMIFIRRGFSWSWKHKHAGARIALKELLAKGLLKPGMGRGGIHTTFTRLIYTHLSTYLISSRPHRLCWVHETAIPALLTCIAKKISTPYPQQY